MHWNWIFSKEECFKKDIVVYVCVDRCPTFFRPRNLFWGIFGSTFRGIFGDIFLGIRDVKGQAAVQSVSLLTGAVHLSTLQLRIENSPTEVTSLRSRLFRQVWNEARTRKVRTKIEAWQLVNLPTISASQGTRRNMCVSEFVAVDKRSKMVTFFVLLWDPISQSYLPFSLIILTELFSGLHSIQTLFPGHFFGVAVGVNLSKLPSMFLEILT